MPQRGIRARLPLPKKPSNPEKSVPGSSANPTVSPTKHAVEFSVFRTAAAAAFDQAHHIPVYSKFNTFSKPEIESVLRTVRAALEVASSWCGMIGDGSNGSAPLLLAR
jgi:hypothetical protein